MSDYAHGEAASAARSNTGSRAMNFFLSAVTLWQRELVRFFRQPSRIIGALGTPLLFWVLIGSGLGSSFRPAGTETDVHYLQYFFPGTLLLIVMFTSIFSSFSLIEDRKEGFLQAVLVSPASRGSIVLGKVLGGTTLALLQALIFSCLAPLAGIGIYSTTGFMVAGAVFLIALALTSLGFALAWPMDSIQGFHGIMNLLLMPMWLLSGALFPASGASGWIRLIMELNPLTYGLNLLRYALSPELVPAGTNLTLSLIITAAFAAATYAISWIVLCRKKNRVR